LRQAVASKTRFAGNHRRVFPRWRGQVANDITADVLRDLAGVVDDFDRFVGERLLQGPLYVEVVEHLSLLLLRGLGIYGFLPHEGLEERRHTLLPVEEQLLGLT
jgi:hypothetical protein